MTTISYLSCGKSSNTERTTRRIESAIVETIRNFSTLLLLRYISPPPPKTGESPPSGAWRRIAPTKSRAITICETKSTVCIIDL